MEKINPELVEAYVTGNMDSAQKESFESQIAANTELQEEVKFQQQVVKGIEGYRKAQLKARLDQVAIPEGTGIGSMLESTTAKIASGVIVAGLGVGLYMYLNQESDIAEPISDQIVVEQEEIPLASEEKTTQIDVAEETPVQEVIEDIPEEQSTQQIAKDVPEERAIAPTVETESPDVVSSEQTLADRTFTPDIDLPDDDFDPSDDDFNNENNELQISNPVTLGSSLVTVEIAGDSKVRSFKYFDGRLSLFGDFSTSTYEVLELNTSEGRKVYFYFDGDYHSIILTRVTIPLKKIEDAAIINQLERLRQN